MNPNTTTNELYNRVLLAVVNSACDAQNKQLARDALVELVLRITRAQNTCEDQSEEIEQLRAAQ